MLKLKIISLFLCLLLALQMIPLQQIGKMLSSNQWTEELADHPADDTGKADPSSPLQKIYIAPNNLIGPSFLTEEKARTYIHHSAQIPSNHSTDVVSPPPDLLA